MPVALPATTREQVKLLFLQGLKLPVIQSETGVKQVTIRNWSRRYGWSKLVSESKDKLKRRVENCLVRETTNELRKASQQIRSRLSSELASQVELLAQTPARSIAALANSPARQGRTALVKTLAEAAALVHDWDADKPAGIILAVDLRQGVVGGGVVGGAGAVVDVASVPQDASGEVGLIADTPPVAEPDPPSTQSG